MPVHFLVLLLLFLFSRPSMASEDDLYDFLWLDPDKSVFVLQNKKFTKEHKFQISFGYTQGINIDFQETQGVDIQLDYFFNEQWGLQLDHSMFTNDDDDAYKSITRVNNIEPFIRRPTQYTALLALWTPFYGKINTFNKIFYFDIGFGIGPGLLKTESNLNYVHLSSVFDQFDTENFTTLNTKIFLRFYLSKKLFLETNFNNNFYRARTAGQGKELKMMRDINFNFGFSF